MTDTEQMVRIPLWAIQPQGQWRSISTELSPDRHRGQPPHPSQRNGGCSTITEGREVSRSCQHPSKMGPSRWTGCNHCSYNNVQQDLADWRMANPVDPAVLSHQTSQERQPATVPELPNDQPHQPTKQSQAEDHTEQIEAKSGEDHCWRTGRLQSRKKLYRADLQPMNPLWKISSAPTRPLHVFIDFKKAFNRVWYAALWATMKKYNISMINIIGVIKKHYDKATSAVLFNSSTGDWFQTKAGVWQGCLLSPTLFNIFLERIMTDTLEDHKGIVSTGGRTITNICFADDIDGLEGEEEELAKLVVSWQSLHSLQHGDQCWEDQVDDKQHQWHQQWDKSKWTEASRTWA